MRLDWLHKIMTVIVIIMLIIGSFLLVYHAGPHDSISDEILYSICSLIFSILPLAVFAISNNLFAKTLFSFRDSTKRIYHDSSENIYINYNNRTVTVYKLSLFTITKIGEFISNEETIQSDIDFTIKDYFKNAKEVNTFKKSVDGWDGTIGDRMKRDKRIDDILN